MNIRRPTANNRNCHKRTQGPQRNPSRSGSLWSLCSLMAVLSYVLAAPVHAATNLIAVDEIPPLVPPRGEIAPGFWEQYGSWVVFGALGLLVLAGVAVWLLLRPKRPPVITPPAIQAQEELQSLRGQAESGVVLSRVSGILRHYFSLSLGLPPAERTTSEFCSTLVALPQVSPELSATVSDFLRECDERKFAPVPPQPPLDAVEVAAKLIQRAEESLTALAQTGPSPVAPAPRAHDR